MNRIDIRVKKLEASRRATKYSDPSDEELQARIDELDRQLESTWPEGERPRPRTLADIRIWLSHHDA